jgi:hypothetical protein
MVASNPLSYLLESKGKERRDVVEGSSFTFILPWHVTQFLPLAVSRDTGSVAN